MTRQRFKRLANPVPDRSRSAPADTSSTGSLRSLRSTSPARDRADTFASRTPPSEPQPSCNVDGAPPLGPVSTDSHHGDGRSSSSGLNLNPGLPRSATPIRVSDPKIANRSWQTPQAAKTDAPDGCVQRTQMLAVSFRPMRCASAIGPVSAHRHALSTMASTHTPVRPLRRR
jgi:hypothetical protein